MQNNPVNLIDPLGLDWSDVSRMINNISERYGMNPPDSVLYTPELNPKRTDGRADRWNNRIKLPSEQFSKQLNKAQFNYLYQTIYHEMRHLNAPGYQEDFDFWYELITGDLGPYHRKIFDDEENVFPPEGLYKENKPCE